jgi:mannose-6-phosphate isomerase-like protein (cupin superfamily)
MRAIRTGLLIAWFVLIVSLFWDPITPLLTHPDNAASPFRLHGAPVAVQGVELPSTPYAMGNRIFWTMVLPLVPMLLMLLGHETWRRLCPLSHFSQIPRMLGWQRHMRRLNRRTGAIDRPLALIPGESWIRRNHMLFQFGFLTCGLMGRLLFYNADRLALVGIFAFIMSFALIVGLLYGGKTWCNYFCPIAVVQGIYTGPGGLLDSKAVAAPTPVTQSMCRAAAPVQDKSICVGCMSNCADIDLENSYWKTVESDNRRFVYYGFFGLTFAFYTYYYVYSGGWDYYFTGAWTHESGQLGKLFSPGVYMGGHAFTFIPKIIAVPIYFALCIAGSYWMFRGMEWAYAQISRRQGRPLSKLQLRHRMLTVSAFLSFNLFYLFAGRPNLLLLPAWAVRLVDIVIVIVSSIWLWRSLTRSADIYRRESLAKSLREQLRRMGFRSEDVLEGRALSDLSADEVYVLAKTLPGFSANQKREVYRAILAETLESGETRSADSLEVLADLRSQLGLSDNDHAAITQALGISDPELLDPSQARSREARIRIENYRDYLYGLLSSQLPPGITPRAYLSSEAVMTASAPFRTLYSISEEEHASIVSEITDDVEKFAELSKKHVSAICGLEAKRFSLAFDSRPESRLLCHALLLRERILLRDTVSLIALIDNAEIARSLAQTVHALMGKEVESAIADIAETIPPDLLQAFTELTSDPAILSYLNVVVAYQPANDVLQQLASDSDPLVATLATAALAIDNAGQTMPGIAGDAVAGSQSAWLVEEVAAKAIEHQRSEKIITMASLLSVNAFSKLDLGTLADIARRSEQVIYQPGETICQYGEASDRVFVVMSGQTRTWIEVDGHEVTIGTGHAGTVFGELGVITGRPRSASIQATGDTPTTIVCIPRKVIEHLLSHDITATRGILDVVSGYLLDTMAQRRAPALAELPG